MYACTHIKLYRPYELNIYGNKIADQHSKYLVVLFGK